MADTLITGTTLIEKESRSIGDVPIGGIIPWLKNLSGVGNLPDGWVLCDGSAVSDALSPLNGVTIPDLNGDALFIRGNDTAGATGGATTSAHTHGSSALVAEIGIASGPDELYNDFKTAVAYQKHNIATGVTSTAPQSGTTTTGTAIQGSTDSDSTAIIPPFHNVVWICRTR